MHSRDNACAGGISLSGHSEVSLTKNMCRLQLFCVTGTQLCCIRCGPDEERTLDVVAREDGARNSG